jgi:hypothetical protein
MFKKRKIKILALVSFLIAGPVHAQNGCCQLSASSCRGEIIQAFCEQELKGMFQEGVACRPDTGKCGVVADEDIPNPLLWALGGVFLCLLGFVVVIVFIAKRTRKSMNTKF